MSDVIIFGFGCFVSLVCGSAVALLLWGAAHEPAAGVHPDAQSDPAGPPSRPTRKLESESLA